MANHPHPGYVHMPFYLLYEADMAYTVIYPLPVGGLEGDLGWYPEVVKRGDLAHDDRSEISHIAMTCEVTHHPKCEYLKMAIFGYLAFGGQPPTWPSDAHHVIPYLHCLEQSSTSQLATP